MWIFHVLSDFGLAKNTLGFSAADFIELVFCILLAALVVTWQTWGRKFTHKLVRDPVGCALFLALLPVALRLALYPNHPVPLPQAHDDSAHLLVADTLLHFRLANPPHPFPQFFETIYVLQRPTYSSIYPLGQGMVLAAGKILFGHPWGGVILSIAAFCALCYWMLRGWTTPLWAFAGGLLAVLQFGVLSHWINSYWGGAVSACAGCLVFGALPRLRRLWRAREAVLLGLGLGLQALTRPFEAIFLALCVALYLAPALWNRGEFRRLTRVAPAFLLAVLPAAGLILLQNKAITGSWTTLPYQLSQAEYGVPATLVVEPMPTPSRALTPQQRDVYKMQRRFYLAQAKTFAAFFSTFEYRLRFYRFFFFPPLLVVLPFAWLACREKRFFWMALFPLIFMVGGLLYPFFFVHYVAAITCLFLLWSVVALERLSALSFRGNPLGRSAAAVILFLCGVHFLFWYGLHVFDTQPFSVALRSYENADAIDHRNNEFRTNTDAELKRIAGKLVVFVHYSADHSYQFEWVYNAADIDASRIVWAHDLGPDQNAKLLRYFPSRSAWLFYADDGQRLVPYAP